MKITLVTGNHGKLREWQRLMPPDISMVAHDIDVPEIQSLDAEAIVADKAKRAFDILQTPVCVEDVTAGLVKLNGLPGPFIKFFLKSLGNDALYQLAGAPDEPAYVGCSMAYFDGTQLLTVYAELHGRVVAPRGDNGFGFDATFMPDGSDKTFAEMTDAQKDQYSHRALAMKLLIDKLETI